jgi:hypothetical protein
MESRPLGGALERCVGGTYMKKKTFWALALGIVAMVSTLVRGASANQWGNRLLYFHTNFNSAYCFHRCYIDSDNNTSSGFKHLGGGWDRLIEDDIVYTYVGNGSDWKWAKLGSSNMCSDPWGKFSWSVSESVLQVPSGQRVSFFYEGDNGRAPLYLNGAYIAVTP